MDENPFGHSDSLLSELSPCLNRKTSEVSRTSRKQPLTTIPCTVGREEARMPPEHPEVVTGQIDETRGFVEQALLDFGLQEEFKARPLREQHECLSWIAGSPDSSEEENRVSYLLDALASGDSLAANQD
jgi:hypothetical protein